MTMDVITYLSFGKSVDAIHAPDFGSPIIRAMDASTEVFVRFKHADWYKNMIMNCPPNLSKKISPATAGLVDLQQVIVLSVMLYQVLRLTDFADTWTANQGARQRSFTNR